MGDDALRVQMATLHSWNTFPPHYVPEPGKFPVGRR